MEPEATGAEGAVDADVTATDAETTTDQAEATPKVEDEGPKSIDDLEGPGDGPASLDDANDEDGDQQADAEDEADGDGDQEDAEADPPEMREFDFGGNKLEVPADAVPPELADKIDEFTKGTWADYTRKSQEVAEQTKSLTARAEAVEKLSAINGEALQTYSRGLQLRTEIEQLSQVDLTPLWQSEPDRARRISDALAAKQAEFQSIVAVVGQQEQALDQAQREEIDRRSQEGREVLDKRIKNFTTEHAPAVVKYAVENYGMSQTEADQWATNPVVTEMAYKAMLYDRMQTAKAGKTVPPRGEVTKPVKAAKTAGRAQAPNNPDKMSMGQLRKHLSIAS